MALVFIVLNTIHLCYSSHSGGMRQFDIRQIVKAFHIILSLREHFQCCHW